MKSTSIRIVPYQPQHEPGIKALCRIPVSGSIALSLEREPSYYDGASIQCESPAVFVCLRAEDDFVCGLFNIGYRRLYYDGALRQVRYLCDLRIHPKYQKATLLYRMIRFVGQLELNPDGLPAQTVVFADNLPMIRMINQRAQRPGASRIPYYWQSAELVTTMLTLRRPIVHDPAIEVRRAVPADLPAMQAFWDAQAAGIPYCPHYDFSALGTAYYPGLDASHFFLAFRQGRMEGICGIWDQKGIKQTRISAYSIPYQLVRPWYNLYATLAHKPRLPKAGSIIHYLSLHSLLIERRQPAVFAALLSYITQAVRPQQFEYLLFTLDARDPLSEFLKTLPNKRQMAGYYYLVNYGEPLPAALQAPWVYLDMARI